MQRPTACAKRLLFAGSENLAASRSGSHILAGAISVTTGHRLSSGGARLWPSRRGLCSASRTRLSCSHWGYAASRRFLFGATATAAAGILTFSIYPEIKLVFAEEKASQPAGPRLSKGFIDEMSALLNNEAEPRFVTDEAERENHSKDASYHARGMPDAVVFPRTTEEVQKIVNICSKYKVPIIPYGSGTSLEGHTIADFGGITLDFTKHMAKVLAVHVNDMDVVVQPGIKREELNDHLKQYNLFFPLDPGPSASLGGMVGTSCSGTHAVRYGTMKENVLSLKAVLPNGSVVKTGQRSKKSSAGYDLTHLFVGSEGTLGIVTEITLRLKRLPEKTAVAVCEFPTVHDACVTVIQAMQEGVQIGRVELLDELMMKAVNLSTGLKVSQTPTLFFEFSGSASQVEEQERQMRRLALSNKGTQFRFAEGEESEELWSARKNALWHSVALRPGYDMLITDVCVPISRLAECIDETKKDLKDSPLIAPLVGHVGDGNFHLLVLFDASSEEETKEVNRINDRLVQRAISMEGSCTGEHGIGTGKKKWLAQEKGPEAVELMRLLKRSIDPQNLFNPGKVI